MPRRGARDSLAHGSVRSYEHEYPGRTTGSRKTGLPCPNRFTYGLQSSLHGSRTSLDFCKGWLETLWPSSQPVTTVVAPAIGNAIFAAVGVRLRHLPIRPAALRKALASHGGAQ
jgi:hypothetical protein